MKLNNSYAVSTRKHCEGGIKCLQHRIYASASVRKPRFVHAVREIENEDDLQVYVLGTVYEKTRL